MSCGYTILSIFSNILHNVCIPVFVTGCFLFVSSPLHLLFTTPCVSDWKCVCYWLFFVCYFSSSTLHRALCVTDWKYQSQSGVLLPTQGYPHYLLQDDEDDDDHLWWSRSVEKLSPYFARSNVDPLNTSATPKHQKTSATPNQAAFDIFFKLPVEVFFAFFANTSIKDFLSWFIVGE